MRGFSDAGFVQKVKQGELSYFESVPKVCENREKQMGGQMLL